MTDTSRQEAGARLAHDLRRIREMRKLSVQDVNNETKIPVSLLTSFEQTALFDHQQFNRVYLRSVVRTYATAVGVSAERAADALDAAFEGAYGGELAQEYLGESPAEQPAPSRRAEERPSMPGRRLREEDEPAEKRSTPPPPAPKQQSRRAPDADWTSTSPPSRRAPAEKPAEKAARIPKPRSRKRKPGQASGWIFAAAGILVLAALIWFLVSVLGTGETQPIAAEDTVAVEDAEPEPAPVETRPAVTLGDVMIFYVIAESDKLDPIRVTVDDDLRRPYWLEQGDSLRFEAQERIVFEERLDRARLTVEGYSYPMDRRDDQGRIVITRDDARAFFESGAPS